MNKKTFAQQLPLGLVSRALVLSSAGALMTLPTTAVELPNGQTAFNHPPRLIRTETSFSNRRAIRPTYHFTLEVPADAGEPLEAVQIVQHENIDTVEFKADKSHAFVGDSFAGGPELSLAPIGGVVEPGMITVVFDPPVQPGNTVTVAVQPRSNPFTGGAYLFGVTAYPEGLDSLGQFLGYGRINIYGN